MHALLATRTFASPDGSPRTHRAYGLLLFQYYLTYPLAHRAGSSVRGGFASAPTTRPKFPYHPAQ